MEESKELQGVYKIFRTAIYVSLLIEFFMYAIDPEMMDYWNGVVCDVHSRIKSWFLYHDGHLVYSKIATFALICITCVGTRNKKHLEFNARKQVLYQRYRTTDCCRMAIQLYDRLPTIFPPVEHHFIYGDLSNRNPIDTRGVGQYIEVLEGRITERPVQSGE